MRVTIRHTTRYSYDAPGAFAVQRLRLTPADNRAQSVLEWRVEAPGMEEAASFVDGFGNRIHLITTAGPHDSLTVTASGEVDTFDTGGVLGDLGEAANPRVFLRETKLTRASAPIEEMADEAFAGDPLSSLHGVLEGIAARVAYDVAATDSGTSAAVAFEAGRGVCQDHAHIFIAAARRLAIPARYVTGYLYMRGEEASVAHHAWAEAFVPALGWVGFDPANAICPTERYVRLACGFDAPSAAPITGARRGRGAEHLDVAVVVQQQQ